MSETSYTAQVTIRYVNPKQPGKKNASVKTDDGQLYFVAPEMLGQFEQGGRYNIRYKVNDFKGVKYSHIEEVARIVAPVPTSPVAAHNTGTKASYGTVDMATAERIFVCGALNAMLHGQTSLETQTLVAWVNILRETWRQTLGNPQQDAELNDEIPY